MVTPTSMEEIRLSVTPSLPQLRLLADLHIYLVPLDGWLSYQKLARNYMMDEAVSLGFVRVQSQLTLHDLRKEMEDQLDKSALPKVYVFLRSVGRNLAQVKPKQEFQLKVRDFIPPFALEPELYVLQSPTEWQKSTVNKNGVTVSNTTTRGLSGNKRFNPRKPIRKPNSRGKFRYPRFPQKTVFPALQSGNATQVSAPSGVGGQHSLVLPPVSVAKVEATPSTTVRVEEMLRPLSTGAIKETPANAVKFPRIKEEISGKKRVIKSEPKVKSLAASSNETKKPTAAAMTTTENTSVVRLKRPRRVSVVANVLRSKRTVPFFYRVRPNSHMARFYARYPSQRVTSLAVDGELAGQMTRSAIYRVRHAQCYGSTFPGTPLLRSKPRVFRNAKKMTTVPQLSREEQRELLKGKSFVVLEESIGDIESIDNSPGRKSVLSNIYEEPSKEADNVSISINSSENTPIMSKSAARKIRHAKCFQEEFPSPVMTLKGVKNQRKEAKKSPRPNDSTDSKRSSDGEQMVKLSKEKSFKSTIMNSDLDRYMMSINELKKLRHANCFNTESSPRPTVKTRTFYSRPTFKPKTLYKGIINDFGVRNKDNISITDSSSSQSPARIRGNPLKPLTPSPRSRHSSPNPEPSKLEKKKPKVYIQGQNGVIREITKRDVAASVSPVGCGNMSVLNKEEPTNEAQKEPTKETGDDSQELEAVNSKKLLNASPKKTPMSSPLNKPKSSDKSPTKLSAANSPKPSPKASPKTTPKTPTKTTPKETPKATPKATPKPTPKTTPKTTPKLPRKNPTKVSPKKTPKASPKGVQKTTSPRATSKTTPPKILIAEATPEPPKSDTEETEAAAKNLLEVPNKPTSEVARMSAGEDNGNSDISWTVDIQVEECASPIEKEVQDVLIDDSNENAELITENIIVSNNDTTSRLSSPATCRCEEDANSEGRIRTPQPILLCSVDR